MNYAETTRQINWVRKHIGKNLISEVTVAKHLRLGRDINFIINWDFKVWWWVSPWSTWKFKLTEKDFARAKLMYAQWMSMIDITNYFRVSPLYFNYKKRKWKFDIKDI